MIRKLINYMNNNNIILYIGLVFINGPTTKGYFNYFNVIN